MAKKKSEQIEASTEDQALVRRVDEMMSTEPVPDLPKAKNSKSAGLKEKILSIKSSPEDKAPASLSEALKDIKLDDAVQPEEAEVADSEAPPELRSSEKPERAVQEPEASRAELSEPRTKQPLSTNLDDRETDRAVDEIAAKEGDTILALEDAKIGAHLKAAESSQDGKLKTFLKSKWFRYGLIVLLLLVFAVPMTRYKVLGLAIKRPATIVVVDSKTSDPVNEAEVTINGVTVQTDADGKATVSVGVGQRNVTIAKQYYKSATASHFVGFTQDGPTNIKLTATGRLVPITVTNKINGKPVANASIKVLNTSAKTNAKGKAFVALPITAKSYEATITAPAYNKLATKVELTDKSVAANTLALVPAGRVYFLSTSEGSLDVVRTNLDGSDRQVAVEGTGQEDPATTSLLASHDWRYLILKSKREGGRAALYLIDTKHDKVSQFDSSNAEFNLIGWSGHSFVYSLKRNDQQAWQAATQVIKSYDAERQQLNQLDQNQAEGNGTGYALQNFANFQLVDATLVYTVQWSNQSKGDIDTSAKNDVIRGILASGQGKKDYQSFPSKNIGVIDAVRYLPPAVYYSVREPADGKTTYYEYKNQAVKAVSITKADFDTLAPDFMASPAGTQHVWDEISAGQLTLFTGSPTANKKKQLAGPAGYAAYGWYSNNYLLVSNASSELAIIPVTGLDKATQPLKVTDYYRPAQMTSGYGSTFAAQ